MDFDKIVRNVNGPSSKIFHDVLCFWRDSFSRDHRQNQNQWAFIIIQPTIYNFHKILLSRTIVIVTITIIISFSTSLMDLFLVQWSQCPTRYFLIIKYRSSHIRAPCEVLINIDMEKGKLGTSLFTSYLHLDEILKLQKCKAPRKTLKYRSTVYVKPQHQTQ